MDQNIISSTSQNNHIMLYTDTQVQKCNNADHINHHVNHTNNSDRPNTKNNHYHDTALSNSSDSNNSTHSNPTGQLSGGNDYNMHWKLLDNIHYNSKPAQTDIRPDNIHSLYTEDTRLKEMTITADMLTDSNLNTQRQLESVTNISSAFNGNTQRLYTNTIYISGSIMSYTGNGATQLERPTL
jgi:hypothetical protein